MADPIYLVVKGMRMESPDKPKTEEEHREHSRYFYEEHTCPVNYLRDTLSVIHGNPWKCDDDPHGLFKYIGEVPLKGNEDILGEGDSLCSGQGIETLALFGVQDRPWTAGVTLNLPEGSND